MEKFSSVKGISAPLINKSGNQLSLMMNVDTDMIIPKQFLKTIKRSGLGKNLFDEMRYDSGGKEIDSFILNKEPFRKAKILIAGKNFGCGSSREHAPWSILDFGIKVIIAGAGGAAHLPGMIASLTPLPVIGVPVKSRNSIDGWDSVLSILQMPSGVPVGTVALNGGKNAGILAAKIIGSNNEEVLNKILKLI